MFHLGWFVGHGYSLQSWRGTWSGIGAQEWMKPQLYIDMAKALERACFDYMLFEDVPAIPDAYQGSTSVYLKNHMDVPRNDPTALAAILGQHTKHLGYCPTISTSFYPPFMAARMLTTLDHLTDGHIGGNLVTSNSHRGAQNFGRDQHFEHDLRYEIAGEWVEVVRALWESWDPDAVVLDPETGVFADGSKVHDINFEGRFFKVRGPLNTPPGPQRQPVIAQAGASTAGRAFAAKNADTMICVPLGVEAMKAFREDISAQMIANGRNPKDLKVMYLIHPVLADTDEEAKEKMARRKAMRQTPQFLERALAGMSYFSTLDMSKFDLDKPLPDLTGQVNGHQSSMARYAKDGEGKTLRELALSHDTVESVPLVGSPDTVAAMMGEVMDEVGGDGFMLANEIDRKTIAEIADGLVPALKKRGLTREAYGYKTFKENLLEF